MYWKTSALFMAALVVAGSSYLTSAGEAKSGDKKALQGSWTATKGEKKLRMTIDGNKYKLEIFGETASGTFTIDSKKTPKTMDLLVTKGTGEHTEKFEGKTAKAIYEIEGNKLKWCSHEPGVDERPKAFPAEGDKGKALFLVFDREKK